MEGNVLAVGVLYMVVVVEAHRGRVEGTKRTGVLREQAEVAEVPRVPADRAVVDRGLDETVFAVGEHRPQGQADEAPRRPLVGPVDRVLPAALVLALVEANRRSGRVPDDHVPAWLVLGRCRGGRRQRQGGGDQESRTAATQPPWAWHGRLDGGPFGGGHAVCSTHAPQRERKRKASGATRARRQRCGRAARQRVRAVR